MGPDAAVFLQGQFTNDVRLAGPEKGIYGLWLSQKGKIIADSFILKAGAEEFLVGSYFSSSETIRHRLEDYLVADDVTVEDLTPGWAGISLIGEGTGAWLARLSPRVGVVFPGRRCAGENWEWIYPGSSGKSVRAQVDGWSQLDDLELERLRVAGGIPAVPQDAGPDDLPHECGLESVAISSTKGCYLGQEIMARLTSKGRIRRHLRRIRGRGPVPPLPAALLRDGREAGELRSAVPDREGTGFTGLALLKIEGSAAPLLQSSGGLVEIV